MKKSTIIILGIVTVLVIGLVVFDFTVKGVGIQPAEVAQTVTGATSEIIVPKVEEVFETEVEEVVEEEPGVEETLEEESSIVEAAEGAQGASIPEETEFSTEAMQPKVEDQTKSTTETEQAVQRQPNQTAVDAQREEIIDQLNAMGAIDGIPESNFVVGNETSNVGLQWE